MGCANVRFCNESTTAVFSRTLALHKGIALDDRMAIPLCAMLRERTKAGRAK